MKITCIIMIVLCQCYAAFAQIQLGDYRGKTRGGKVSLELSANETFSYRAERGALLLEHQGSWFVTGDTLAMFFPSNCGQPGAGEATVEGEGIRVKVLDLDEIKTQTFAKNVKVTLYSGENSETKVATPKDEELKFEMSAPIDSMIFHSRFCREKIIYEPTNPESNSFEVVLRCYRFEFVLHHTFVAYQLWKIKNKKLINLKTGEKLVFKTKK